LTVKAVCAIILEEFSGAFLMKIAIMQPYFFPYIGYWQLINAVDSFVIYDDVNYIKGGWINKNNILLDEASHPISLSLNQASSFKKINEINILNDKIKKRKLLACINSAYLRSPHYKEVFPLIKDIINFDNDNLALFLKNQIKTICDYLDIKTKILISSKIEKDNSLKAQDKVIEICKKSDATQYINAIGGMNLYSKNDFEKKGIKLNFIKSNNIKYKQFENEFVPWLSIIDVMMFNSPQEIREMLDDYELI